MSDLHHALAQRRLALGLTQAAVADGLGVTQSAVSLWEANDGAIPRYSKLRAIARVYQIPFARLRGLWLSASDGRESAA